MDIPALLGGSSDPPLEISCQFPVRGPYEKGLFAMLQARER